MKVVLLPQAVQDLDRIADPLRSRVIKQLEALARYPDMGAPMAGPFAAYRSFVVELFRIVYRVTGDVVEVAYVRDCRRKQL